MLSVFSYSGAWNLGDAIQSIALANLLPGQVAYRDRDTGEGAHRDDIHLANGYLNGCWSPAPATRTIFAGVHLADATARKKLLAQLDPATPIGARDPFTKGVLAAHGIDAPMVGCATLTFPRYAGQRHGVYAVDAEGFSLPCAAERISHQIPADMSWPAQLRVAQRVLDQYAVAEAVFTTRLHVLLPCLAFGTPVHFMPWSPDDADRARRFTLLAALGVEPGRLITLDVTARAETFRRFVASAIGVEFDSLP